MMLARKDLAFMTMVMVMMFLFIVVAEDPDNAADFLAGLDDDGTDDGDGDIQVERREVEALSEGGYSAEGSATDAMFTVTEGNVIGVKVLLEWTDDIGSNDLLGLTLSNETKTLGSLEGTSGSLELSYTAVEGEHLIGDHRVSVEAIDCPGMVGPLPVDRDGGNQWTLTVTIIIEG